MTATVIAYSGLPTFLLPCQRQPHMFVQGTASAAYSQGVLHDVHCQACVFACKARTIHVLHCAGLDVSETHALVSSDAAAELHHITAAPKLAFAFSNAGNPTPVLYGQLLFRLQGQVMEVCSMAGIVTQRLQLAEVRNTYSCHCGIGFNSMPAGATCTP